MDKITRDKFQARLQNDWQAYIERFQRLSPEEQKAFLQKQGYARLGDLLAHIIAWWEDGAQAIAEMRTNPAYTGKENDVDDFNAQAVERFRALGEEDIIQVYDAQRQVMLNLVNSLPDDELNREDLNTRLYYEIIMHWTEHELN